MSFRRKTYPEITDNLLGRLLGGVSAEAHAYPPPLARREPFKHALDKGPARDITSVYGLIAGVSSRFAPGTDFELTRDGKELVWKTGGARPDLGSVVEISYLPNARDARIDDIYPGSIVRTLLEAVSLEVAGLYAQLDVVYRSGFVDTAEGKALDHVVSLLGVERVRAGRNTCDVQFTRAKNSRGEIFIPAGTRLLTADASIEYETLSEVVLSDGQATASVSARDLVETNEALPADSLVLLAKAIAGVESVTNPGATSAIDRDENDLELRARAKNFLTGSERGTLGAIYAAITRQGLLADVDDSTPGLISVLFHNGELTPEQKLRLEAAVREAKPAGVAIAFTYGSSPEPVDLALQLTTAQGLLIPDLLQIQKQVAAQISDYFKKLPVKSAGSITKLIGLAMGIAGVEDTRLVRARIGSEDVIDAAAGTLEIKDRAVQLGELVLTDPAAPTQLAAAVRFSNDVAIPDRNAIEAAFRACVSALNDASTDPTQTRALSWGQLALATPLPGHASLSLAQQAAAGEPTLPTPEDLAPYDVQFTFTRPGASASVLVQPSDALYTFETFERVSLAGVTVQVKPKASGGS